MPTTKKSEDEIFDESNEVASNWVTWGKEQDRISGTLVAVREMVSKLPGKEGQKIAVYEVKVSVGEFHQLDEKKNPIEPAIIPNAGDIYNIGGKPIIDRQMRNIKLGTKIGLKYTETQAPKNKGFNPLKVIKVYVKRGMDNKPEMDNEWLKEQQNSDAAAEASFNQM